VRYEYNGRVTPLRSGPALDHDQGDRVQVQERPFSSFRRALIIKATRTVTMHSFVRKSGLVAVALPPCRWKACYGRAAAVPRGSRGVSGLEGPATSAGKVSDVEQVYTPAAIHAAGRRVLGSGREACWANTSAR